MKEDLDLLNEHLFRQKQYEKQRKLKVLIESSISKGHVSIITFTLSFSEKNKVHTILSSV